MKAGGISIHAVDVASGRPAEGLEVRLLRVSSGAPEVLAEGHCGPTGLFEHPTVQGEGITEGRYIAQFLVGAFFSARNASDSEPGFLDEVSFQFGVGDARQHYHLPFKFTAWGYSLFRGGL